MARTTTQHGSIANWLGLGNTQGSLVGTDAKTVLPPPRACLFVCRLPAGAAGPEGYTSDVRQSVDVQQLDWSHPAVLPLMIVICKF